jgi:hypothetical protein
VGLSGTYQNSKVAYPVLGETFSADISQYFRNFVLLVGPKKYLPPKIILNILLKIKYKIPPILFLSLGFFTGIKNSDPDHRSWNHW